MRAQNIANFWFAVTRVETELGNVEASVAAQAEGVRYVELAMKDFAKDSFRRRLMEPWIPATEATRLFLLGNFAAARELASAAVQRAREGEAGDRRTAAGPRAVT